MIGDPPASFALSEVLGGLSYALDITEGEPPGHAVRTLAIGMRLGEQLRLGDEVRSALFYALLLKDAGCTANASRLSSLFGADDQAAKAAMKRVDWSRSGALALYTWRSIEPGGSPLAKVRRMHAITREDEVTREAIGMRCERGAEIARMLDLPEPTADAIRALDEHWDGSGHPLGLRGEDIPLLGRILCLAQSVEVFVRTMGARGAHGMALKRRGRWFDPALVDALLAFRDDAAFWAPLEDPRAADPGARALLPPPGGGRREPSRAPGRQRLPPRPGGVRPPAAGAHPRRRRRLRRADCGPSLPRGHAARPGALDRARAGRDRVVPRRDRRARGVARRRARVRGHPRDYPRDP